MVSPQEERTFIAIKPDAVQRGLVGDIIKRFEQRGYKLIALKMVTASKEHLRVRFATLTLLSLYWLPTVTHSHLQNFNN